MHSAFDLDYPRDIEWMETSRRHAPLVWIVMLSALVSLLAVFSRVAVVLRRRDHAISPPNETSPLAAYGASAATFSVLLIAFAILYASLP